MGEKVKKFKFIKKIISWTIIVGVGISLYATYIEPHLLVTKNYVIKSSFVTEDMSGLKIVHFSDTQLGDYYSIEDLERAVEAINKVRADVVIFTGDLIDHMKTYEGDINYIATVLGNIQAKYGKYAVYGNHDQGGGAHRTYPAIMKEAGFKLLVNQIATIPFPDRKINIIGIDDWLLGFPELESTLKKVQPSDYNIVLIHEPDVADLIARYPIDLQLSGHTHGGQVQLPGIGALVTPPIGHKYTEGMYKFNERFRLYVTTGLGNTKLPFRFMNIPEITVIRLKIEE